VDAHLRRNPELKKSARKNRAAALELADELRDSDAYTIARQSH
jgi:hypothetical protein